MKLQITTEISHVKGFHMKLQITMKFHMYMKGFHMKLQITTEISHVKGFT
jgi:uncharacterized integral membrane protein